MVFHCIVDLGALTIVDLIILDAPYKASTSRPIYIDLFGGVIISDLTIMGRLVLHAVARGVCFLLERSMTMMIKFSDWWLDVYRTSGRHD
jgi:hypothetical protein